MVESEAGAEKDAQFYAKLQSELLSLSSDSEQAVAKNSGHFVIIDRPDVVVDSIRQVVDAVMYQEETFAF
jgi:hypothetical protein